MIVYFADCRTDWRPIEPKRKVAVLRPRQRRKRWMGVNAEVVDQVDDKGRKYIRPLRKIPPLVRFG